MAQTDAQRRAKAKYDAVHYKTLGCKVQTEEANQIREHAARRGETASTFILRAVREQMRRDNGAGADDTNI